MPTHTTLGCECLGRCKATAAFQREMLHSEINVANTLQSDRQRTDRTSDYPPASAIAKDV